MTKTGEASAAASVLLDLVAAPRGRVDGAAWRRTAVAIDEATARAMTEAAGRVGAPPSELWLRAWAFILGRFSGEPEIAVGRVDDGGGLDGAVVSVDDTESVSTLLSRAVRRVAGVAPDTAWASSGWSGGLPGELPLLVWQFRPEPRSELAATYRAAALDEPTVRALGARLIAVAARLADSGDVPLREVPLLDPAETDRLLIQWNSTGVGYRPEATVHGLFRERAEQQPDATAIEWDGGRMSYAELARKSLSLARRLAAAGVRGGDVVAVALDRSPEAVIAALAVLQAGGAYLPLDVSHPAKRLAFTVADAGARAIVSARDDRGNLPVLERVVEVDVHDDAGGMDESPVGLPEGSAEHLAYVMYTSGSTGTPKGVQVEHRCIVRLVGRADYMRLSPATVMLHAAPLGFDASTLEIWGPLLNGGRLVVHGERVPTGRGLARTIREHGVTSAWLTAALFNAVVDEDPNHLAGLEQLLTGGESLSVSRVRRALAALPATEIINGYGPTECTTFTTTYSIPRGLPEEASSVPIGRPIADTRVYVLNRAHAPVPVGVAGELWVGGRGVSRGYLNRPELDAERFAPDDLAPGGGRLYRTGDLVRWLPDGTLEFVGRIDEQLKIRGFRIEPGEIEAAIARQPGIRAAAVVAHPHPSGEGRRLVAYVVPAGAPVDLARLRAALGGDLPDFMVPSAFVELPALPVTENGKLDRRALPLPGSARPDLPQPYRAPDGPVEAALARVFEAVLGIERVGTLDGFFELGGNSLLAMKALQRMRDAGLPEVSAARFFAAPTVEGLARAMAGVPPGEHAPRREDRPTRSGEPIAIIGMAARLPGARNVARLWENLCAGRDSVTRFAPEDLDPSIPPELVRNPDYVRARGIVEDVELFDAAFFGVMPLEAQLMDPQHRLFLETAWEALEDSGHVPETTAGRIGVFAGMYNATYFQHHVQHRRDLIERIGELNVMLGNEKDYLTSRAAYRLALRGPAVTVQTACSTSLVAVCQAADSLQRGECEMALAGGVAVTCPPRSGYLNEEGTMTSPDGVTRTFDAGAAGTVFSDGVAVVVLKRLSDALADGDRVEAVILGGAVNNDGAGRASFTAPNPDGQAAVILAALDAAGVEPRTIDYVETHGTATPIGDPIEIEGLTRAFRRSTADSGFCAVGSLKSNIGHTTIASGAAGLIKVTLALSRRLIPATIHFEKPNPKIDFAHSPFVVCSRAVPWDGNGRPRRAGVSSFGFGGTNAHVVVEEAPPREPSPASGRPVQLLLLSAQTGEALDEASARLGAHLQQNPELPLADVAHTLRVGRRALAHRRFVVAPSGEDAARQLAAPAAAQRVGERVPEIVLLFPGQGSQYARMGQGLHATEPAFRAAYDECCRLLAPHLGGDPRERFFSDDPAVLTATSTTQPAVFTLEYSLARLLLHLGVRPAAFMGHSVGEFVGAVLAGVMPLEDALALVALRGRLMQALPRGSMLSVRLAAAALEPRLPEGVSLAAENGPSACVASGPTPAIEGLARELEAEGVIAKLLVTSHAFHSPMMDPVIGTFGEKVAAVRLSPPSIPVISTVTGRWLSAEEATSARYWAEHLRRPVRFSPAVTFALAEPRRVLVETGPRATLSTLARQHAEASRPLPAAIATMADAPEREPHALASAVGRLWQTGLTFDWEAYVSGERRQRVALPTYPFQGRRHWVDAPVPEARRTAAMAAPPPAPRVPAPVPSPVPSPLPAPMPLTAALPPIPSGGHSMPPSNSGQRCELAARAAAVFDEVCGLDPARDPSVTFTELGLDSLALTQIAQALQQTFAVKISLRQLMESLPTFETLVAHLEASVPKPEVTAPAPPAAVAGPAAGSAALPSPPATTSPVMPAMMPPMMPAPMTPMPMGWGLDPQAMWAMQQQFFFWMQQQMAVQAALQGWLPGQGAYPQAAVAPPAAAPTAVAPPPPAAAAPPPAPAAPSPVGADEEAPADIRKYDVKKAFGAIARIHKESAELTPKQRARLEAFIRRYGARTRQSKEHTQRYRGVNADPRVVTGFRPAIKELVYPIVCARSKGAYIWDLDGNRYVDALNGFGCNYFGWQPDFVNEAVKAQIDLGIEIGPQTPLAGEVAELFCEYTGNERAAFCNTGSEAVMGCTRIARTVTGRSKIALFTGSYHGIFDEVIVRATRKGKAFPAAPGIVPNTAENVLVLDYGTPESLEMLRAHAHELAAVLVEPVQSRRPEWQPREFLHEVRKLTAESGALLIFDEVITGFRTGPRGAQGFFGIEADLGSYGKVVAGGYPIGIIAGKAAFMDALDGGQWRFGDESGPTAGVTYFAGTFVRHPLALAACKAVLLHLKKEGPALQERMNARTAALARALNDVIAERAAPLEVRQFSTLWKGFHLAEHPYADVLFFMLRDRGIHIYDGFPCFLTTAHSDEDVETIVHAFRESLVEMQDAGLYPEAPRAREALDADRPPVAGARLGRDTNGDPAWFVPNPDRPGKYLKVN